MKLIVIDTLCEKGHINFNNYFVKTLTGFAEVDVVCYKFYSKNYLTVNPITIPDNYYFYNNKLHFRLKQIMSLRYIRKYLETASYDYAIFISYDNISLSLIWRNSIRTIVFNHNNIDRAKVFFIERIFFRFMDKRIIHVCYEDYISNYIQKEFKRNIATINHPLYTTNSSKSNKATNIKKVIFVPSSSSEFEWIDKLVNFAKRNENFYIVAKSKHNYTDEYCQFKTFFNNIEDEFIRSDYVFLPVSFEYRVSGFFYEAMSYGKHVILTQSLFSSEMKKQYPKSVTVISNISQFDNLFKSNNDIEHMNFMQKHSSENITSMLKELLNNKL